MRRTIIGLSLFAIALSSCSSSEDVVSLYPSIHDLENTECVSLFDTDGTGVRGEVSEGAFEMVFEKEAAKCKFTSLDYPCDFERVNVNIKYDGETMTIIEYPSSDMADCRCEVDASFIIKNIPQNDFILKIYPGDTEGNYNIDNPKYEGRVNRTYGKIVVSY